MAAAAAPWTTRAMAWSPLATAAWLVAISNSLNSNEV
jgi:hypothetical protein